MLIAEGHNITNFPSMPQVIINNYLENDNELHVNLEDIMHILIISNRQYNMLNDEQKNIVDKILEISNVIDYNGSRCFYIDGPGGSGKTSVYTKLYNLLKSQNKNVCCMVFTGIAAMLLPKGILISSNIAVQSKEGQLLK